MPHPSRLLLVVLLVATTIAPAFAQGTLRIAMTLADIPLTTGQPDQGMEGYRFAGYPVYNSLVAWDLSRGDIAAPLRPGLALSWHVDPANQRRWIFELRPGVRFHDGSAFDANAAVWNLDKIYNETSPQYDPRQGAQVRGRLVPIESYRAIGPLTLEIVTRPIDAFFPWEMTYFLFSSPAQWEKLGRSWDAFARQPSGTGPFRVGKVVPRESLELLRNPDYWDAARVPKLDRIILLPVPDAATRASALLARQVDWVEAPASEMLDRLRASGMQIAMNLYPHIWPWEPSRLPGSPWNDIRVRRAVNLAIDRDGMTQLLHGTMRPAVGHVYPGHPWFGSPNFHIRHDPAEAKRLLAEAGYSAARPLRLVVAISPSGSGQMEPLLMNQFLQQNLAEVGVQVDFEVLEWDTSRNRRRLGAKAEANRTLSAINNSLGTMDPSIAFLRQFHSEWGAPAGFNWGYYRNPEVDRLIETAQRTFDTAEQDRILAQLHTLIVDDAVYVFVAHDLGPRALAPTVKGFVAPQSWIVDLTQISLAR